MALARRDKWDKWKVWRAFLDWLKPADQDKAPSSLRQTDRLQPVSASFSTADPTVNFDETAEEFDEEELLDFLAADLDPVPADPDFRENLREQLWALVRERTTSLPKDH
jgi:hypothetical protein